MHHGINNDLAQGPQGERNEKVESLEVPREHAEGTRLTTSRGLLVSDTDDSLKPGPRGPTLLEDFLFREKMMHFDHERIPERVVEHFARIDARLAREVAEGVGVGVPDGDPVPDGRVTLSPALSMESDANRAKRSAAGLKIAVLIADGFDGRVLEAVRKAAEPHGAIVETVSRKLAPVPDAQGKDHPVDKAFSTTDSVLHDAVCVPGGDRAMAWLASRHEAASFVRDAYAHGKPVCIAGGDAVGKLAWWIGDEPGEDRAASGQVVSTHGLVTQTDPDPEGLAGAFLEAVAAQRHWGRVRDDA